MAIQSVYAYMFAYAELSTASGCRTRTKFLETNSVLFDR